MALIEDPIFRKWVESYAEDRDLFFSHFASAFAKLIELGVDRSDDYEAAPKKSDEPQAEGIGEDIEAEGLRDDNRDRGSHKKQVGGGCPMGRQAKL